MVFWEKRFIEQKSGIPAFPMCLSFLQDEERKTGFMLPILDASAQEQGYT